MKLVGSGKDSAMLAAGVASEDDSKKVFDPLVFDVHASEHGASAVAYVDDLVDVQSS